ncbi:uncharacterized protein LOC112682873 [Sipha flava]|uniref:Uncharacterized protein LOC112682873 n=1 Tax=Sipha flava TaxID=143950 RepID=A0A8B8FF85_9HEMI|nr:uncharacterized protein LOC112682873 [Sipha flava]
MADSKCCFGCSNVRNGTWVISIFDMLICSFLAVATLSRLSVSPYPFKSNYHSSNCDVVTVDYISPMDYDFLIFNQLCVLFYFFYLNLNLKNATYIHNAQIINQWLVTNSIFFVFFLLTIGFITLKNGTSNFIPIAIPISIVVIYQIYVVKCFYDDEVKFLAISARNAAHSTIQCAPIVSITNQSVQAPPLYPVQAGPYVMQQGPHPVMQASYPQQTYQYETQQPSSQSQPDQRAPQEYCNPPPYSPAYNMHEGFSAKQ